MVSRSVNTVSKSKQTVKRKRDKLGRFIAKPKRDALGRFLPKSSSKKPTKPVAKKPATKPVAKKPATKPVAKKPTAKSKAIARVQKRERFTRLVSTEHVTYSIAPNEVSIDKAIKAAKKIAKRKRMLFFSTVEATDGSSRSTRVRKPGDTNAKGMYQELLATIGHYHRSLFKKGKTLDDKLAKAKSVSITFVINTPKRKGKRR